jgi:predicted branched-subunit amino acid permease
MIEKTWKQEFWNGVRDEAPILMGVVPFGLLFGALAISAHLSGRRSHPGTDQSAA